MTHHSHLVFVISLKVCDRSRSPQWNEVFYFVVHDPRQEMLIVKVSALPFLVSTAADATDTFALFIFNVFFTRVAFKRMGPADGLSCTPRETVALPTTLGPG